MKTKILMLMAMIAFKSFSQDSLTVNKDSLKTRMFCFTPKFKNVDKVNGLTIGAGLRLRPFGKNNCITKVNGLNIEINPLAPIMVLFADPSRIKFDKKSAITINGINMSTGSVSETLKINGFSASLFMIYHTNNGISAAALYNYSCTSNGIQIALLGNGAEKINGIQIGGFGNGADRFNGLQFAFIANDSEKMNGMQMAFFNNADTFNGVQLGVFNYATTYTGIQLGIFNKSDKYKGLQLGFWNINSKRSMPFLNW